MQHYKERVIQGHSIVQVRKEQPTNSNYLHMGFIVSEMVQECCFSTAYIAFNTNLKTCKSCKAT